MWYFGNVIFGGYAFGIREKKLRRKTLGRKKRNKSKKRGRNCRKAANSDKFRRLEGGGEGERDRE